MAIIGFGAHTLRPAAVELAATTAAWLRREGHETRLLSVGHHEGGHAETGGDQLGDLDLAVSLGGDGTMLRTIDLVSPAGIPVLGVNLGHLGYLTTVEPDELAGALRRFLDGDHRVESRMTIDVTVSPVDEPERVLLSTSALNDVVLARTGSGHTVRASLSVDERPFLTYAADAVLVATPTGSTAYNLSARGPVLSPLARAQIVTPVAPHMLFDRSLVLGPSETISLAPIGDRDADVLVDGWGVTRLRPGQVLRCRGGSRDALLVTFAERDFLDILKRKFNLVDP